MPSPIEAKERLIRDFQTRLIGLRRDREPLKAGEQTVRRGQIDVTGEHIAQLNRSIAEYERLIPVLERRVRNA
jgi:hypothetical protein